MTWTRWIVLLTVLAVVGACSDHEFHPPGQEARLERADSLYEDARFDTIEWRSDAERIQAGNLVFADECRRCHGPLGRGGTEYAESYELDVPSLVEQGWEYDGMTDSVRYHIFVGHGREMPQWGVGRLTPKEIDAVAAYITDQLRPEMLSDTTTIPAPLDSPGG